MKDKVVIVIALMYLGALLGVITFWSLVIYALYLLVTGQLHLG